MWFQIHHRSEYWNTWVTSFFLEYHPLLLYFFPQGHFPRVYKLSYAKMKEFHFQEEMLKICVEGKISFNPEKGIVLHYLAQQKYNSQSVSLVSYFLITHT